MIKQQYDVNVLSKTIYEFNLLTNVFSISDADVIIPIKDSEGLNIKAGSILYKKIRETANDKVGGFKLIDSNNLNLDNLAQRVAQPKNMDKSEINFSSEDNLFFAELKLEKDLLITDNDEQAGALFLQYNAPIEKTHFSNLFMFNGAIQPSDYKETGLKISTAIKQIEVIINSPESKFSTWLSDPRDGKYYPDEYRSNLDNSSGFHSYKYTLNYKIFNEWNRAQYFSLCVKQE